jgi:regulator of sigma E protease
MITILAFIIVLGILIFFHELGHFIMAKASGVGVLKFSLGFGPAILKKRIGETQYQIAAFPLGGFVKMLGEDPDEKDQFTHIDPSRSFAHKKLGTRALIVFSGPLFNFLLAVLIYTLIAWTGIPTFLPVMGAVQKGSPADCHDCQGPGGKLG